MNAGKARLSGMNHGPEQLGEQGCHLTNGLSTSVSSLEIARALGMIDAAFALFDRSDRLVAFNAMYKKLMKEMGAVAVLGKTWMAIAGDITTSGGKDGRLAVEDEWISSHSAMRGHLSLSRELANGQVYHFNEYLVCNGGFAVICTNMSDQQRAPADPAANNDKASELRKSKARLSPREREVLSLLARGSSMKEVARVLRVTPRTVAFHKYRMMRANGLRNNTELIALAVAEGLLMLSATPMIG